MKDFALTIALFLAEFLGEDSLCEELIGLFFQHPFSARVLQSHKVFAVQQGKNFQTNNIFVRKCHAGTCRDIQKFRSNSPNILKTAKWN